jgi:hypothetical protein
MTLRVVKRMSHRRRSHARNAVEEARTALLVGRCLLRLYAGRAPWRSRSRARLGRLVPSRPGR